MKQIADCNWLRNRTVLLQFHVESFLYEPVTISTEYMVKQIIQGHCSDVKYQLQICFKPWVEVDQEYQTIRYNVVPVLGFDLLLLADLLGIDRNELGDETNILETILKHGC